MTSVSCPACTSANSAEAAACLACGVSLSGDSPASPASPDSPSGGEEPTPTPTSKLSADSVDGREVVAWLSCEPLAPVPLVPGAAVTVGRSPGCDLVLRHQSVSRVQAVIEAHGQEVRFTDRGSSNGTFHNGRRAPSGLLEAGDVLTFGPYEVEVHSHDSITSLNKEMDKEGTQVIEVSALATGLLHETSLAELLQGIELNRKSGTLKILAGSVRGSMHIERGRPVRAVLGADRDEEAAIRMLSLGEGRYTFSSDVEPADVEGPASMRGTITGLLLEASRRADEGQR